MLNSLHDCQETRMVPLEYLEHFGLMDGVLPVLGLVSLKSMSYEPTVELFTFFVVAEVLDVTDADEVHDLVTIASVSHAQRECVSLPAYSRHG